MSNRNHDEGSADGSIFGVKDGSEGPGGNWYDLTGPLPFVEEVKEDVVEESA